MKEITLKELQTAIAAIDHKNHAADQYFYKLAEEVGELAKAIRKGRRLESYMMFSITPYVLPIYSKLI